MCAHLRPAVVASKCWVPTTASCTLSCHRSDDRKRRCKLVQMSPGWQAPASMTGKRKCADSVVTSTHLRRMWALEALLQCSFCCVETQLPRGPQPLPEAYRGGPEDSGAGSLHSPRRIFHPTPQRGGLLLLCQPTAARGPDGFAKLDLLHMRPSHVQSLIVQSLISLSSCVEAGECEWPHQMLTGLVHCLDKAVDASGLNGFRPIVRRSIVYRT